MSESGVRVLNEQFRIVSYDGAGPEPEGEDEYGVEHVIKNDGEVHCTDQGRNFNLVLEYQPDNAEARFTLTHVLVKSPANCTAPIKTAAIFVSDQRPDVSSYTERYNDMTAEQWEALSAETKAADGAIAFVDAPEGKDAAVELDAWARGRFIHVKFIAPHDDENIDVEYVGLVGFDQKDTPAEASKLGPIPTSLGILRRKVEAFNQLHADFGNVIGKELSVVLLTDVEDIKEEKVNAAIEAVRTAAEESFGKEGSNVNYFYYHLRDFNEAASAQKEFVARILDFVGVVKVEKDKAPVLRSKFSNNGVALLGLQLEDNLKYLFPAFQEMTASNVTEFAGQVVTGQAELFFKSADAPENDEDPAHPHLKIITHDTFERIVLDAGKNVLVGVFDFEEIEELEHTLAAVADLLKDEAEIVIGRMDQGSNDAHERYISEEMLPGMFLFPKGKPAKRKPVVLDEQMGVSGVLEMIHENMKGTKFDLDDLMEAAEEFDRMAEARNMSISIIEKYDHMLQHLDAQLTKEEKEKVVAALTALGTELNNKENKDSEVLINKIEEVQKAAESLEALHELVHEAAGTVVGLRRDMEKFPSLITTEETAAIEAALKALEDQCKEEGVLTQDSIQAKLDAVTSAASSFTTKVKAAKAEEEKKLLKKVHKVESFEEYEDIVKQAKKNKKQVMAICLTADIGTEQKSESRFADLSEEHPNVRFLKVNVEDQKEIAEEYEIQTVPTFVFLKGGKEVEDCRLEEDDEETFEALEEYITNLQKEAPARKGGRK